MPIRHPQTFAALTIVLFSMLPLAAFAQMPNLSGYVKTFMHPNLNSPYRLDRYGVRLQLALSQDMGSQANFYAAIDFNIEENQATGLYGEPRSAILSIFPVEAYIDLHWSAVDLRVGKQFIFWGKADWVNPTDNIIPWDFQNIDAELEDYRLPVSALRLDWYPGDWQIQGVVVPVFKPNRLAIQFPDSMGSLPVEVLPPQLPDSRLENWQFGVRASSYWQGFDFSLSFWRGFDLFPSVYASAVPAPSGMPEKITFQQRFLPIRVFGVDFARAFGQVAIKGEGAYFQTRDASGTDPAVENPHIQYVLGLDYYATDKLTLNGQFIQTIRLRYSAEEERAARRRQGEPHPEVPEQTTNSMSLRVQYGLTDNLDFQLVHVLNFAHGDFFVLPMLTYSLADGLNLFAGASIFQGEAGSPFGNNKAFSRAFFELKYSF